MTFDFDYSKTYTDEDNLITGELLVRLHTKLLIEILDHPSCSQEIKDLVEKSIGKEIIPLFQNYVGIKMIIKPKLSKDCKDWELGQIVFKNGMRYPYLGKDTFKLFPEVYGDWDDEEE